MDAREIGRRLRDLREVNGDKTLAETAKEIGVSLSALAMYERGERIPRDEIKIRLAAHYGKSVQAIFYA